MTTATPQHGITPEQYPLNRNFSNDKRYKINRYCMNNSRMRLLASTKLNSKFTGNLNENTFFFYSKIFPACNSLFRIP